MDSETFKNNQLIIGILILAAALRILGIWHDYPFSFYPDEAHFVKRALAFGSLDFNPHWFHKPAFFMYLLFFEYGAYFVIGKILSWWQGAPEFAAHYIGNPGTFYMIGRVTVALFSVATIWVVFRLGEKHFYRNSGILAALLLAVTYGHVDSSQDIKADVPAAFFMIASMFFLLNYLNSGRNKDFILTLVFAGIGTATKYYPGVMLLPISIVVIWVHFQGKWQDYRKEIPRILPKLVLVPIIFYGTYFIFSPFNFLDPLGREQSFSMLYKLADKVSGIFAGSSSGGGVAAVDPSEFIKVRTSFIGGVIDYIKVLGESTGMGILIAALGLIGLIFFFTRREVRYYIFSMVPIIFGFISVYMFPGYAQPRHQLPIYPFLAISGGALIVWIINKKFIRERIAYGILGLLLLLPLYRIVERDIYVSKQESRNYAKNWIEKNIPAGSKLLVDENGPPLMPNLEVLQYDLKDAEKLEGKGGQFTTHYARYLGYQIIAAKQHSPTYDIDEIRFPWWRDRELEPGVHMLNEDEWDKDLGNPLKPVGVEDYDYYVENGFDYAVVHEEKYRRFINDTNTGENFPSFTRFYRELFQRGELIKEFDSEDEGRPGPTVKIFRFIK